jgi:hypothetical protein
MSRNTDETRIRELVIYCTLSVSNEAQTLHLLHTGRPEY